MERLFSTLILALGCCFAMAAEPAGTAPSKPAVERKDAFFGVHFDLHPAKSDTALGRDVTEENIRAFLRRVRPDYVQYDCVGVPGYSGYPTKVGWPAPGIVKDSLALWRQVTREERVALLIHYCVLWNQTAVERHPDWAAVNATFRAPSAKCTVIRRQSTASATVFECWAPKGRSLRR